jgi:ABC-type transport system involved in Fe-S cluster assembly fused permease/ATPase subunit
MDRGTAAANTLITYLFLYTIPALAECLAVVILFFVQYQQYAIGGLIAGGVGLYVIATIRITLWRAKFRCTCCLYSIYDYVQYINACIWI